MKKLLIIILLWLSKKELQEATSMDHKGNLVRPFSSDCKSIDLEVIFLSLSRIKRFFGQTKLSVAQHCVNMTRVFLYLGETEYAKQALLHEVSEAYMGDLPSPFKAAFPIFKILEERIIKKVFLCYGLQYPMAKEVHVLDKCIMIDEAIEHMPKKEYWESIRKGLEPQLLIDAGIDLEAWSEEKAFDEMMNLAKELKLL